MIWENKKPLGAPRAEIQYLNCKANATQNLTEVNEDENIKKYLLKLINLVYSSALLSSFGVV